MRAPLTHRLRGRMRSAASVAGAVLALAVLTGCAGIPWSGPVQVGVPVAEEPDPNYDFIPSGPQPDATPDEIVQGFIDAGTGARNDYAVARQFLTERFAQQWNPSAGATVTTARPDAGDVFEEGGRTAEVSFTVAQTATVDAGGRYTAASGSPRFDFALVRTAGDQWRIDSAPDGTVLSASTFEQVFGAYALYFYDPAYRYLVPDLRWFPTATSPSRIVTELIAGPSSWLAGGVLVSAFPQGTELTLGTVPVESGRARVDLNQLPSDAVERERLHTQLVESLSQVTTVSSVALSVDQTPVDVAEATRTAVIDPLVDERPLVVRAGVPEWIDDAGAVRVDNLDLGDLRVQRLTYDAESGAAVARTRSGAWLVPAGGSPIRVDERPDQAPPTLDGYGWAWTASTRGGPIRVSDGATQGQIDVRSTAGRRVVALEASRDSTRMLTIVERAGARSLVVAGVLRDGRRPVGLGPGVPVPVPSGAVIDAAWYSDTEVAVLAQSGAEPTVWIVELGGAATSAGEVPEARAISAANAPDGLRVLLDDGLVQQRSGNTWTAVARDVDVLATVR